MTLRKFVIFFTQLSVLCVLLLVPWPGVREAYGRSFCVTANRVFGSFGENGLIQFTTLHAIPKTTANHAASRGKPSRAAGRLENDVAIQIVNRRVPDKAARMAFPSQRMGYIPTALVVALILATPIAWYRRAWALLWGLLLVHAFVGLKVLLFLLNQASVKDDPVALYAFSPFWKNLLREATTVISLAPWASYTIPVLIWVIATLRRQDLEMFRAVTGTSSAEDAGPGDPDPASKSHPAGRKRRKRKQHRP